MKLKTQSEIRTNPMDDPVLVRVMMERKKQQELKRIAAIMNTTMSELIRFNITKFIEDYNKKIRY